jgi:hypothetical protein
VRRIPRFALSAFLLAVSACDTTSHSSPASSGATATPTPGLKSPLVHEAPQPAERIAPEPTPTVPGS